MAPFIYGQLGSMCGALDREMRFIPDFETSCPFPDSYVGPPALLHSVAGLEGPQCLPVSLTVFFS